MKIYVCPEVPLNDCSIEGPTIYQNYNECAGERGTSTIMFSCVTPLQTRRDDKRTCNGLGFLIAMGMMGPQNNRGQMVD